MVEKQLCPECIATGNCWFKDEAERIASEVENNENPIILLNDAANAHQEIAENRIKAREKCCRNLNNIDPDYPGKKLL